jgi:hypothetical protein
LWRAAPGRLRRTPGWLLLVLVAATLLVASAVAPALFVATARATALTDRLEVARSAPFGAETGDLRVTWDAVLKPASEQVLLDRLATLTGYDTPTVGASGVAQSHTLKSLVRAGGVTDEGVLWYHDGAVEALGGDPDADGIWLPVKVADRLGIEVGDRVGIGLVSTFLATSPKPTPTVLAGTYETAPDSALPAALVDLPDADRWYLPVDPEDPSGDSPLAIAGRDAFDRLLLATGETPLYVADLRLDPDVSPDGARTAVEEIKRLGNDAYDGSQELGRYLTDAEPQDADLGLASGLPDIVFDSNHTATSARDQVRPYAVAGQVLAAALLVGGWVLLGRGRRREQVLASGLGLRPGEVAGLTALEVLPVCLVAAPAGLALALLGIALTGPSDATEVGATTGDLVRAGLAALLALLLMAGTAAASAAGTDRQARVSRLGGRRLVMPWGTALLVATVAVGVAVLGVDVARRSSTPLAMLLPVLVAATVALAVARTTGWLRGRRTARTGKGSARWLASRRTGTVLREVTALTVVVAVALGLFGYSLTVRRGLNQGVDDKTAALVGARSTLEVAEDFRRQGQAVAVTAPAERTSTVWRRGASIPPTFGEVPVLAIDPKTFADVADWGGSGTLDDGRELVPRLLEKAEGLPVILSGEPTQKVGDHGTLDFSGEFQIPFEVVGVVAAFPGSESATGTTTVIINARKLLKLLPPTVDPRAKFATSGDAGAFSSWVWSDRAPADLRAALDDAGVTTDGPLESSDRARVGSGLVAATWAAAYVLALGCVALALAVAASLVLALRLADRDAVSDVLLGRMGFASGELARSRTWEVGYAVLTAVLAAGIATTVLVLGPTVIDATATIPPLTRPRPDLADLAVLGGVFVGIVLVAWLIGAQRARRRHPAEVLRGNG